MVITKRRIKRAAKRAIIRWEMEFYLITILLYAGAIAVTWWLFPDVGNLALQLTILFTGLTATIAATASAIKSDDTEE